MGFSSLGKTCFTSEMFEVYKMTATGKVSREEQFTILVTQLEAEENYFFHAKYTNIFLLLPPSSQHLSLISLVGFCARWLSQNSHGHEVSELVETAEYQYQEDSSRRAETKLDKTKGVPFVLQNYLSSATLLTA